MRGQTYRCMKHRKEAFASKVAAQARLDEVLTQDRIDTKGRKPNRVHYDENCGFWHLTSQRRTAAQIRRQDTIARRAGQTT